MATSKVEIPVRLIDVEGIHGLIENLSNVAGAAVPVVEDWNSYVSDERYERSLNTLRDALIALNDYVDNNLHDDKARKEGTSNE